MASLLNLATLAMATSGFGGIGRSLLAVPRLLSESWNPAFGTEFAPGTIIPSYLYNETAPPPYAMTEGNVTVVSECVTGMYDCECLIQGDKCQEKKTDSGATLPYATECAINNQQYGPTTENLWAVITGGILMCVMAFGIGANDSANSWATAIGSGAIRATYGLFIGGLMEWAGAVALGYAVSGTIRKGIAPLDDPDCWACGYCNSKMAWYNVAMVATLIGAVFFTMLATYTAMPISTTHAVVGGACGATIAGTSWGCLNWSFSGGGLFAIMASWVTSPVLSGLIASASYLLVLHLAVRRSNPRKHCLIAIPACAFCTTFIFVFMVMVKSQLTKNLPKLIMLIASIAGGVLSVLIFAFGVIPRLRKHFPSMVGPLNDGEGDVEMSKAIKEEDEDFESAPLAGSTAGTAGEKYLDAVKASSKRGYTGGSIKGSIKEVQQQGGIAGSLKAAFNINETAQDVLAYDFIPEEVREAKKEDCDSRTPEEADGVWTFRYLLVYQAALESFAHGANDTANATGAFIAIWNSYQHGIYDCAQKQNAQWIMIVAGFFVALGVNTFGYRVIHTIGTKMTDINYLRGWCVEFAVTTAVTSATLLGMPVSTTHCVVGGVVFIGITSMGLKGVAWGLVGKIGLSWIVTLPFAGAVGYIFSWLLSLAI